MPKSDEARPISAARTMQKRVETKEDGRLLIYYTFETSGTQGSAQGSAQGLTSGEPAPKKAEDSRK
jgi:hypothetical protein